MATKQEYQEQLHIIERMMKAHKVSFTKCCEMKGFSVNALKYVYPKEVSKLIGYSLRISSHRVSKWKKINIGFRFFCQFQTQEEIAKIYGMSESSINRITSEVKNHFNKFKNTIPKSKMPEFNCILKSKEESYWQNEDEVLWQPTTFAQLSDVEKQIYFNIERDDQIKN